MKAVGDFWVEFSMWTNVDWEWISSIYLDLTPEIEKRTFLDCSVVGPVQYKTRCFNARVQTVLVNVCLEQLKCCGCQSAAGSHELRCRWKTRLASIYRRASFRTRRMWSVVYGVQGQGDGAGAWPSFRKITEICSGIVQDRVMVLQIFGSTGHRVSNDRYSNAPSLSWMNYANVEPTRRDLFFYCENYSTNIEE